MSRTLTAIYRLPLPAVCVLVLALGLIWYFAARACVRSTNAQRAWTLANRILLALGVLAITAATVLTRPINESAQRALRPFYQLSGETQSREAVRLLFMNAFLFFPIGLTLPFAIEKAVRAKRTTIFLSVLTALLFSCILEGAQYVLARGVTELDDVLMNTLGAALGTIPFCLLSRPGIHGTMEQ